MSSKNSAENPIKIICKNLYCSELNGIRVNQFVYFLNLFILGKVQPDCCMTSVAAYIPLAIQTSNDSF